MTQGSTLSLHLQVAKGHTAVLPGANSDPGNHQRATAVPPTLPDAAVAAPLAWDVQLGSKIWKVASGFSYITCQSSQRQPVAGSEIKIRVSFQFQMSFMVPCSTEEPPSNKQGGLNTSYATYHWKRSSVSPPGHTDFAADTFTAFTRQQNFAQCRSHLPDLHLPHHYAQWKGNSPQTTWSKSPFFIPHCHQISALPSTTLTELQRLCASSACRPRAASTWNNFKLWTRTVVSVNLTRLVICLTILTCLQYHKLWNQ